MTHTYTETYEEGLPESIRVPLHELQADTDYLFGRVAADGSCAAAMAQSVKAKLALLEIAIKDSF